MTRAYSEDLRERALRRADAGETIREIAAALQISPSCVSKWRKLRRETGGLAPGQIGGHKKRTLSDERAEWLRAHRGGAVHVAGPDGGVGRARDQDGPPRGVDVPQGRGPEL
jgi:transposase-like protein